MPTDIEFIAEGRRLSREWAAQLRSHAQVLLEAADTLDPPRPKRERRKPKGRTQRPRAGDEKQEAGAVVKIEQRQRRRRRPRAGATLRVQTAGTKEAELSDRELAWTTEEPA